MDKLTCIVGIIYVLAGVFWIGKLSDDLSDDDGNAFGAWVLVVFAGAMLIWLSLRGV